MINNIEWELLSEKKQNKNKSLQLKFDLQKGCYATSLLREFMKLDNVRDY